MSSPPRTGLPILFATLTVCTLGAFPIPEPPQDPPQDPPKKPAPTWAEIEPIFEINCTICHGGAGATRGLDLETRAGVLKGSKSGAVVVSGKPAESELVKRIRGTSKPQMPLDGPPYLTEEEIGLIESWIGAGLPDAAPAKPVEPGTDEKPQPEKPAAPEKSEKRKPPAPGEPVLWSHVAPTFAKRCVKCHKDGGLRGDAPEGLELFSLDRVRKGGERVALIPGNATASPIYRHIQGIASPRMPLDGPPFLSGDEIELMRRWIDGGALDSAGKKSPIPAGRKIRYRGRLTGIWQIDGIDVIVDRGTRIDKKKRPSVGDEAEVRAVILPDGRIRATRLRRR